MSSIPIYSVASCNGGGVRGIIPALILAEIEKRTSLAAVDCFDLFTGTSAGAFVAGGLNRRARKGENIPMYTASKIVELFKEKAATIFPYSPLTYLFTYLASFVTYKYDPGGLESVLNEYCGDMLLSDSIREILIPAAKMPEKEPWWFTRDKIIVPLNSDYAIPRACMDKIPIVDVLRATSAAPTFFPFAGLEIHKRKYSFMDGGTFANNPARMGITYAKSIFGPSAPTLLGTFGTGEPPRRKNWPGCCGFGKLFWASEFPKAAIELENRQADLEVDLEMESSVFKLEGKDREVLNIQPQIAEEDYNLDDSSKEHIERLMLDTQESIEKNDEEIRSFCERLRKRKEN